MGSGGECLAFQCDCVRNIIKNIRHDEEELFERQTGSDIRMMNVVKKG